MNTLQALEKASVFIEQNQLENALNLLAGLMETQKDLGKQISMLASKFSEFKERKNIGDLSDSELDIKRSSITYGLLDIIAEAKKRFQNENLDLSQNIDSVMEKGSRIIKQERKIGIGSTDILNNGVLTLNVRRRFLTISLILLAVICSLLYFWPKMIGQNQLSKTEPLTTEVDSVESKNIHPKYVGQFQLEEGYLKFQDYNSGAIGTSWELKGDMDIAIDGPFIRVVQHNEDKGQDEMVIVPNEKLVFLSGVIPGSQAPKKSIPLKE